MIILIIIYVLHDYIIIYSYSYINTISTIRTTIIYLESFKKDDCIF